MKTQAKKSIQYTIRGVPDEVDRVLRRKARSRKVSLNQLLVEELANATGKQTKKRDVSKFLGIWEPDPEFDRILEEQRQIDWDKWK